MPGQQWHAWPLLRCLELETSITSFLQGTDMQAFSQLHTLKLRAWGAASWPISEGDLDLTSLPSLRRLHIENWSPESISVTTRCRVHAIWQQPRKDGIFLPCYRARDWLLSPCWTAPSIHLAPFNICDQGIIDIDEVRALQRLLERHHELKVLRITTGQLGSKGVPFAFPPHIYERQDSHMRAKIRTSTGLWL